MNIPLAFLVLMFLLALAQCLIIIIFFRRLSSLNQASSVMNRLDQLEKTLLQSFTATTADMAARFEKAKGDLRQDTADRLTNGLKEISDKVERQLGEGRREQFERLDATNTQLQMKFDHLRQATEERLRTFADRQTESLGKMTTSIEEKMGLMSQNQNQGLADSRQEMTKSLALTTKSLEEKFDGLGNRIGQNLEAIRGKVDERLLMISEEVQKKLDQNIKEGFSQFEKVQEHLKAAEERLKEVGAVGASINDLNNLLKLPHLRGKFGEVSLERLLADFLPAHMYEIQTSVGEDSRLRPDALITFPDRKLPIDSKFPREQVLALFESNDPQEQAQARAELVRVVKEQARSISRYIKPEEGTTDMALMFLPSETLWFEVVHNSELSAELSSKKIFPVSPNTLLLALHSISLVYKWYQIAKGFEKTTAELAKAQKSFGYFQQQFEKIGKDLGRVQESYQKASGHLTRYQNQVTKLTGEEIHELPENIQPIFGEDSGAGN